MVYLARSENKKFKRTKSSKLKVNTKKNTQHTDIKNVRVVLVIGSGFLWYKSHTTRLCECKKIYSKKQRWDIWMNYSTNQNAEGSDGLSSMLRF